MAYSSSAQPICAAASVKWVNDQPSPETRPGARQRSQISAVEDNCI